MSNKEFWTPDESYSYLERNKFKKGFPNNAYATKNFRWNEYFKDVDDSIKPSYVRNAKKTIDNLQTYRDKRWNSKPVNILSGYRSPSKNSNTTNSSRTSLHQEGLAADFTVNNMTPQQVQSSLDPIHKGKLEYAPTWTHISLPQESDGYLKRKGITRNDLNNQDILNRNIIRGFKPGNSLVKRNFNQSEHDKIFNSSKKIPTIEEIGKMSNKEFREREKEIDEWQKNGQLKYEDESKWDRLKPRNWFKR